MGKINGLIKISIIIPAYNVEKYISKCLDSILMQSYSNFEVIIIDDVSTDGTKEIIKKYQKEDDRIRVIFLKKNQGSAIARQKGLEIVTGDYITFIDADDWYDNNQALDIIVDAIIKSKFANCICFRYKTIHTTMKNRDTILNKNNGPENGLYTASEVALIKEKTHSPFWHYVWNKCYKAEIIKLRNIKFCSELRIAEDVRFNQDFLIWAKEFYVLTDYLYCYNCSNVNSVSKIKNEILLYESLFKRWKQISDEYLRLKSDYLTLEVDNKCLKYLASRVLTYYLYLLKESKKYNYNQKFINDTRNDEVIKECNEIIGSLCILILKGYILISKFIKSCKLFIKKVIVGNTI